MFLNFVAPTRSALLALLLGLLVWANAIPLAPHTAAHGLATPTAVTHYVAPDGLCGGQTPCYSTLQAAANAAQAGDEIKVAAGVYTTSGLQVLYLSKALTLRGGYTTSNWDHADPVANPTVLDAQGTTRRRGLYINAVGAVEIHGLTITNGRAGDGNGGGIYVGAATTLLLNQIALIANTATYGGGLYVSTPTTVTVEASRIISNVASYDGGGVYMHTGQLRLSNSLINYNQATSGGGISNSYYMTNGITIGGSTFEGNQAFFGGGAAWAYGHLVVDNALFQWNSVSGEGGALRGSWQVSNSQFYSNTARDGGAAYLFASQISASVFVNNDAETNGGALYVSGEANTMLQSNRFFSNTAGYAGGALAIAGAFVTGSNDMFAHNSSSFEAVYLKDAAQLEAFHWTLVDNGAYALTTDGIAATARLTNTIVASHTVAAFASGGPFIEVQGVLLAGNKCGTGVSCTQVVLGDPVFANPAADDYHLRAGSWAIDAGVPTSILLDMDQEARPNGSAPDLGADESYVYPYALFLPGVRR